MPTFPDDTIWSVRLLRFCNMLDDEKNELSPVKLNLWGANLAAVSTAAATIFAWLGGHLAGIESLWGGVMTWLTQAHVTHHFDKSERNKQKVRMK